VENKNTPHVCYGHKRTPLVILVFWHLLFILSLDAYAQPGAQIPYKTFENVQQGRVQKVDTNSIKEKNINKKAIYLPKRKLPSLLHGAKPELMKIYYIPTSEMNETIALLAQEQFLSVPFIKPGKKIKIYEAGTERLRVLMQLNVNYELEYTYYYYDNDNQQLLFTATSTNSDNASSLEVLSREDLKQTAQAKNVRIVYSKQPVSATQ